MQREQPNPAYRVSVRDLVAWHHQAGDLSSPWITVGRLIEGTEVHGIVQSRRGPDYRRELTVREVLTITPTLSVEVHGRIDGLFYEGRTPVIEEIKTSRRNDIQGGFEEHWSQATCYGAIFCGTSSAETADLDEVALQLTYVHPDTFEETLLRRRYTPAELRTAFSAFVDELAEWLEADRRHREVRNSTLRDLAFPFPDLRDGQAELVQAVERHIGAGDGRPLFVHAPTGIGKTMAVLYPAVQALSGSTERIFYLAAKGTGKEAALAASDRLQGEGAKIRTLVLTAKEKICFHPEEATGPSGECLVDVCPFAKGYFDRNRGAIEESRSACRFDAAAISELARRHGVCPFELSLDLSMTADLVIGDYNYLFDPRVYLRRHFSRPANYVALVDEGHNLPDRAREMFSASIGKKASLAAKRELADGHPPLKRSLGRLNAWFLSTAKVEEGSRGIVARDVPPELLSVVQDVYDDAGRALEDGPLNPTVRDLYFACGSFLRIAESFDDHYRFVVEPGPSRDIVARLFCADPSRMVTSALRRCRSAVLFSGTFVPVEYFTSLLAADPDPPSLKLSSPFPEANRRVLVYPSVDTRYKKRDYSYGPLAELIGSVVDGRRGNYLCYFPSYGYLAKVHAEYWLRRPREAVAVQSRGMDDAGRAAFLDTLTERSDDSHGVTGFAVLGGVFAEGVDLPGRRLDGAVVTGVGLPAVTLTQEVIRDYFEETTGHGFLYAYVYPGLNRVIQAAGRVIRSEGDRGVIVLAGSRFGQNPYRDIVQSVWPDTVLAEDTEDLGRLIQDFWSAVP